MMFNNRERKIINVLYQYQSPLTTGKVTKYTGYSYNIVRKYLKSLSNQGYVEYMHYRNAIYWWLREEKERRNKKMREMTLPNGRKVEATNVDFDVEKEDWNTYMLKDGSILKFKTVISSVIRTEDHDPDTGNPIYIIQSTNISQVNVPESLRLVNTKQVKKEEGVEVV